MNYLNQQLESEGWRILEEHGSKLEVAEAFDLDGNGKKDLVGVYDLSVKHSGGGLWSVEILFVLWDTGRVEKIAFGEISPAFTLGGVIDVDQDGVQELILSTSLIDTQKGVNDGREVRLLRHNHSGWTSIYRTMGVCDPSSSLYYEENKEVNVLPRSPKS